MLRDSAPYDTAMRDDVPFYNVQTGITRQLVTCPLLVRHIHTEKTKLVKTTFVHSFSKHRVRELSD